MDIFLIAIGTLLSIDFFSHIWALYKLLELLKQNNEKKALPLPRNKIELVEDLSALGSMSNSELIDMQLFCKQFQMKLDAIMKYNDEERSLLYALRNGKSKE